MRRSCLVLLIVVAGGNAWADRGALTADAGGGVVIAGVGAPGAAPATTWGSSGSISLGGRYALTHWLEVTGRAFYEPPVTYWHDGVTLATDFGELPDAAVSHTLQRYGALLGAQYVTGLRWRLHAGLELGWSHRIWGDVRTYDLSGVGGPVEFGQAVNAVSADAFELAPVLGIEWIATDKVAVSILPRAEVIFGRGGGLVFTVPLTVSWSWYL